MTRIKKLLIILGLMGIALIIILPIGRTFRTVGRIFLADFKPNHEPMIEASGIFQAIRWASNVESRISSGVLVHEKGVFIQSSTELLALDTMTGEPLWTLDIDAPRLAYLTPLVNDNSLFVGDGNSGKVLAVNLNDGSIDWEQESSRRIVYTMLGELALSENLLVVGRSEEHWYAYDVQSGDIEWVSNEMTTVVPFTEYSQEQLYLIKGPYITVVDSATGENQTSYRMSGHLRDLQVRGNIIYWLNIDNGRSRVYAFDETSRQTIWSWQERGDYKYLLLDGPALYLSGEDGLIALDVFTGATQWQYSENVEFGPVTREGAILYVMGDTGLFAFSPTYGHVLGQVTSDAADIPLVKVGVTEDSIVAPLNERWLYSISVEE